MYYVGDIKGAGSIGLIRFFAEAALTNAEDYPVESTTISLYREPTRNLAIMESPFESVIVATPSNVEELCVVRTIRSDDDSLVAIDADGVVSVSGDLQQPAGFFGNSLSFNPELHNGSERRAQLIHLVGLIERSLD